MNDVTRVLNAMSAGDDSGSAELLASIYQELRRMAAVKMAAERPGHTLQATALVNEAYLRLAGGDPDWQNRRHFFGAASEAMRRILVENARRRAAEKRPPQRIISTEETVTARLSCAGLARSALSVNFSMPM